MKVTAIYATPSGMEIISFQASCKEDAAEKVLIPEKLRNVSLVGWSGESSLEEYCNKCPDKGRAGVCDKFTEDLKPIPVPSSTNVEDDRDVEYRVHVCGSDAHTFGFEVREIEGNILIGARIRQEVSIKKLFNHTYLVRDLCKRRML